MCNFWLVRFQGDRYATRKTPRRIQRVKRVICNANWYCYLFCCRLLFVCLFLLTVSLRDPRRALFYSLLISCSKAHTMQTHDAPQISQWRRVLRWMNEQHQVTQQETNLQHREILSLCGKALVFFFIKDRRYNYELWTPQLLLQRKFKRWWTYNKIRPIISKVCTSSKFSIYSKFK